MVKKIFLFPTLCYSGQKVRVVSLTSSGTSNGGDSVTRDRLQERGDFTEFGGNLK